MDYQVNYGKLIIFFLTFMICSNTFSQTSITNGNGSKSDPYLISETGHLLFLSQVVSQQHTQWTNSHYRLTSDLDLNSINWIPIGKDSASSFKGYFDGNGHCLSNITVKYDTIYDHNYPYVGVFGYLSGKQTHVCNLKITNADINTGNSNIGVIAGYSDSATIQNCEVSGKLKGDICLGGIAGMNRTGLIEQCNSDVRIEGKYFVGGIVGYNYRGVVTGCGSTNQLYTDNDFIGGVAGENYKGRITNSHSRASLHCNGQYSGGICGSNNNGFLSQSFSNGPVFCEGNYAGGLVGLNRASKVQQCYSTGDVNCGDNFAAALIGGNYGSINECYASGQVSGIGKFHASVAGINTSSDSIMQVYYAVDKTGIQQPVAIGDYQSFEVVAMPSIDMSNGTWSPFDNKDSQWVKVMPDEQFRYYPQLKYFAESKSTTLNKISKAGVSIPNDVTEIGYSKGSGISIFPAVVTNTLHVISDIAINKMILFGVNGQLIRTINSDSRLIDVSLLLPGIYILRVESVEQTLHTFEIIKK